MLKLEIVWTDPDLIELEIHAVSDDFAGRARVYFTKSLLEELAAGLEGFPRSAPDSREFATENYEGGNSVKISFECVDAQGHATAEIQIHDRENSREQATVRIPVTGSDIDAFVSQLRNMAATTQGVAILSERLRTGAA